MIRDLSLASGNTKDAIKAIEVMNKMQGYDAPVKSEHKQIKIDAIIDLTVPPGEEEDSNILDIDFDEPND